MVLVVVLEMEVVMVLGWCLGGVSDGGVWVVLVMEVFGWCLGGVSVWVVLVVEVFGLCLGGVSVWVVFGWCQSYQTSTLYDHCNVMSLSIHRV